MRTFSFLTTLLALEALQPVSSLRFRGHNALEEYLFSDETANTGADNPKCCFYVNGAGTGSDLLCMSGNQGTLDAKYSKKFGEAQVPHACVATVYDAASYKGSSTKLDSNTYTKLNSVKRGLRDTWQNAIMSIKCECKTCADNCQDCKYSDSNTCTKCNSGLSLVSGRCMATTTSTTRATTKTTTTTTTKATTTTTKATTTTTTTITTTTTTATSTTTTTITTTSTHECEQDSHCPSAKFCQTDTFTCQPCDPACLT
eukprot:GDKI01000913.1.p1 GENE.GDKI01000913.1~~GDKI01000913.1.p1  ORF type:complete len:257 (+),score=82.55 GDKI01000913.1:130-900(+)